MNIEKLIYKLNQINKEYGNLEVVVEQLIETEQDSFDYELFNIGLRVSDTVLTKYDELLEIDYSASDEYIKNMNFKKQGEKLIIFVD
jgi:hypothetical protein